MMLDPMVLAPGPIASVTFPTMPALLIALAVIVCTYRAAALHRTGRCLDRNTNTPTDPAQPPASALGGPGNPHRPAPPTASSDGATAH